MSKKLREQNVEFIKIYPDGMFDLKKIKAKHDVCHILKVTFVTCSDRMMRIQWSYQIKACG